MMKARSKTIFAAAAVFLVPVISTSQAQAQKPAGRPPISEELRQELKDGYIFVFKRGVSQRDARGRAAALAQRHQGTLGRVYTRALRGFSAKMAAPAAARLARDPDIAYYEPDAHVWALPPGKGKKPGGGDTGPQKTPWGISHVGGPRDGSGRTAWVIDTGIDLDHPDLKVDAGRSANFITKGKDSPDDLNGHGTHVAGTIAAVNNASGVVGVAAGATVVAVRVLDRRGSGTMSGVIAGVDYVAGKANAGDVANLSLGGGAHKSLDDAILNLAGKGVRVAIAAGNEGANAGNTSPARVNHANVWTVSAIDSNGKLATFSNWGNPPVDCAAPGVGVLSTYKDGGTATLSGTSMATPHVAGILLFGKPGSSGTASGDPDGNPDPICHF